MIDQVKCSKILPKTCMKRMLWFNIDTIDILLFVSGTLFIFVAFNTCLDIFVTKNLTLLCINVICTKNLDILFMFYLPDVWISCLSCTVKPV